IKTIASITCGLGIVASVPVTITTSNINHKLTASHNTKNVNFVANALPNEVYQVYNHSIVGLKYSKEYIAQKYPDCNTLRIPAEINGEVITSIEPGSFSTLDGTAQSLIPANITHLDFENGSNLEELKSYVFAYTPITSIDFYNCSNDVIIKPLSFFRCDLNDVKLKDGHLGRYGFATNLGENAKVLVVANGEDQFIFKKTSCAVGSIGYGDIVLPDDISIYYASGDLGSTTFGNFSGCFGIKSVKFSSSIVKLAKGMFANTGVTNIDLTATQIAEVPASCFFSCTNLTSIVLPKGLVDIRYKAFEGCMNLTDIDFTRCYDSFEKFYHFSMDSCPKLNFEFSKFTNPGFSIGAFAFAFDNFEVFNPTSLAFMGIEAFSTNKLLTTIDFSNVKLSPDIMTLNESFVRCPIREVILPDTPDFL
ncbi:MAG: leucine-rich repeat domain-containing protein, partial [Mycoplasmoidaceae bacterium]|nr:leucine-rich repeat domain-containing protein [Mycoplasmoidaceae bacterium]